MIPACGPGELVPCGLAAPGPQARAHSGPAPAVRDLFPEVPAWKAVSIWQPWASLMARGVKTIITFHQATTHRGPVAIHAARVIDLAGAPDQLCVAALGRDWRGRLPTRAIVAVGDLVDCCPAPQLADGLTPADYAAGSFAPGRHAWVFENLRALRTPLPLSGRRGLFGWSPPDDLAGRLGQILDPEGLSREIGWGRQMDRRHG